MVVDQDDLALNGRGIFLRVVREARRGDEDALPSMVPLECADEFLQLGTANASEVSVGVVYQCLHARLCLNRSFYPRTPRGMCS